MAAQLLEALNALYHHPDPKVKDEADRFLEQWQQQVEAWSVADAVLHDPSQSMEAHYFCAQTLRTKVRLRNMIRDVRALRSAADHAAAAASARCRPCDHHRPRSPPHATTTIVVLWHSGRQDPVQRTALLRHDCASLRHSRFWQDTLHARMLHPWTSLMGLTSTWLTVTLAACVALLALPMSSAGLPAALQKTTPVPVEDGAARSAARARWAHLGPSPRSVCVSAWSSRFRVRGRRCSATLRSCLLTPSRACASPC